MNLNEAKLNTKCVIKEINIKEEKTKIRLMELGLIDGTVVQVYRKSVLKKTLLIIFNSTCFTIKDTFAKEIIVNYV